MPRNIQEARVKTKSGSLEFGSQIMEILEGFPLLRKRYADLPDEIAFKAQQIANNEKSLEQRVMHLRMLKDTFELMYSEVEQAFDNEGTVSKEDEKAITQHISGTGINDSVIPPLKQCYRTAMVEEIFDMSKSTIQSYFNNKKLIGIQPNGRNRYYPMFQFSNTGPVEGLGKVLGALECNDENAITFMLSPNPELGDKLPIDVLKSGNLQPVVDAALVYKSEVLSPTNM